MQQDATDLKSSNASVSINLHLDLSFHKWEERRCVSVPVALQLPSKVLQSRGRKGFGVVEGHFANTLREQRVLRGFSGYLDADIVDVRSHPGPPCAPKSVPSDRCQLRIAAGMFHSMALLEPGLLYGLGCQP